MSGPKEERRTGNPYDGPPPDLESRVQRYVQQARRLGFSEDRVIRYAKILVAAEEMLAHRKELEQEASADMPFLAAYEYGVDERDPLKATIAYKESRRKQNLIHNSAAGLANSIVRFQKLLEPNYRFLRGSVRNKHRLKDIQHACDLIRNLAADTVLPKGDETVVKQSKSPLCLTKEQHTFKWWKEHLQKERSHWAEMHALAKRWHPTAVRHIDDFRRIVTRIKGTDRGNGWTISLPCPPWALP